MIPPTTPRAIVNVALDPSLDLSLITSFGPSEEEDPCPVGEVVTTGPVVAAPEVVADGPVVTEEPVVVKDESVVVNPFDPTDPT